MTRERYPKPRRIVRKRSFVYCVFECSEGDRMTLVSSWKTRAAAQEQVDAEEQRRDYMAKQGYPSARSWLVAAIEVRP